MYNGAMDDTDEKILAFVKKFSRDFGYPPTLRDIGASVGLQHTAVLRRLTALQEAGAISLTPNTARSVRVNKKFLYRHNAGKE